MNAVLSPDGMEAGWLDCAQGKLFSCYHPARGGVQRNCAVLLCDPFGSDRMNLHASYRELALRLAAAGFPTLRVDYPGTCDSSGYARDPQLLDSWLASLHSAADWLQRRSGLAQLSVFGALLGGTLAARFAADREQVTGLVLWGALPSGRAFLREAAAMRVMMTANAAGRRPAGFQEGDLECIGFLVPRAMAEQLATIDLLALSGKVARAAAVFTRGRAGQVEPLVERLRACGCNVYVQRGPPVEIAQLVDQRAKPPAELLDEMLAWWTATYPIARAPAPPADATARLEPSVVLRDRRGREVREEVVRFGSDLGLIGIVTQPLAGASPAEPTLVLVNGGSNHRPGINRNYAEWAREWAASGWSVLRLDLRGLGDSMPLRPEDICMLHRVESRADIRAAFEFLERQYGARRFICMGLCAGAYQSLHTALEDTRVCGLVLLNPLRFQGPRARRLIGMIAARDVARGSRELLGRAASTARLRVAALVSQLRGEVSTASWIADAFLRLTRRRCDVLLVFNANDPMVPIVDAELDAARATLHASGCFAIERVEDSDHIFSPLRSQEQVGQILAASLDRWRARWARASLPHGGRP